MEPPGSHRFVACGPGAAAQLAAAGDRSAALDGAACAAEQSSCEASTRPDGRKAVATVRLEKGTDGTWFLNGWVCRAVGPPRVTPRMVLDEASRLVPAAPIGLAPRTRTLVNIQTVMWLDADQQVGLPAVTILGQQVAIGLRLDHIDWTFGDADTDVSATAGKAYDSKGDPCKTKECPDYFGHTYTTTGTMTITATASWRVTFRVGTGAATPIPGVVIGPADQATVRVLEARGVLVPDPTPN